MQACSNKKRNMRSKVNKLVGMVTSWANTEIRRRENQDIEEDSWTTR